MAHAEDCSGADDVVMTFELLDRSGKYWTVELNWCPDCHSLESSQLKGRI